MTFVSSFPSSSPSPQSSSMHRSSGISMEKSGDWNTHLCGERIGNALRMLYPQSTAKLVARDAETSPRTVENWLDGTSTPSLAHFARLIAKHPSLLLALAPVVAWAPVAAAAVEEATMRAALDGAAARRQQALDLMRRGR